MKPIIKKKKVYSLLLMSDAGAVFSCRLRGGTLTFLWTVFLLLLAGGGFGSYWGLHFYNKYEAVKAELRRAEQDLTAAKLELETLAGQERIARSISNGAQASPQGNATQLSAKNDEIDAPAARPTGGQVNASLAALPLAQVPASPPAASAGNGTDAPASAEPALSGTPLSDPSCPLVLTDMAAVSSGKRLAVAFDLSTTRNTLLQGKVAFKAILEDGSAVPVEFTERNRSFFAFSRLKRVTGNLRFPREAPDSPAKELEVIVVIEKVGTFSERYPLASLRGSLDAVSTAAGPENEEDR